MLGLELTDAGFDHTVLSEFRSRLVGGKLELLRLDALLEKAQALGLADCTPCKSRHQCTRSRVEPGIVRLQDHEHHEALQAMRARQNTPGVPAGICPRASIESTHAQAIRRSGLRRARYRGLPKTHLQHILTAAAINLLRIASWLDSVPLRPLAVFTSRSFSSGRGDFATSVNIGSRP